MTGPHPAGTFAARAGKTRPEVLSPGTVYRVAKPFRDADGDRHRAGRVWTFVGPEWSGARVTLWVTDPEPTAEGAPVAAAPAAPLPASAPTALSAVIVDYEGRLEDGTVFDSGTDVRFRLNEVVPGFRDGILGMEVGETQTIVVPPEEGYGAMGLPGVIPGNATLTFTVTLKDVL